MSGISVALRVRPLNSREQGTTAAARCLSVDEAGSSLQYVGRDPPPCAHFAFDQVSTGCCRRRRRRSTLPCSERRCRHAAATYAAAQFLRCSRHGFTASS